MSRSSHFAPYGSLPGGTTESRIEEPRAGRRGRADRAQDRSPRARRPSRGGSPRGRTRRPPGRARRSCRRRTRPDRRAQPRRARSRAGRGRFRAAPGAVGRARRATRRCRRRRRRPSRRRANRGSSRRSAVRVLAAAPSRGRRRCARRDAPRARSRSRCRTTRGRMVPRRRRARPPRGRRRRRRGGRTPFQLSSSSRSDAGVLREDAALLLREDAVARERAQQPVERVGVGAGLAGELLDRSGAFGEDVRDPSSAAIASARVVSAPRRRSQPIASGDRSLIRGPRRPRPRPRRARRRRACGSRAAGDRRGRCRPPAARPVRSGAASSSSTAHAKLGSSASGSAPPPTRATVSSTVAADELGQPLGTRADRLAGLAEHPQHRDLARGSVEVQRERPFERGERELVGAQRALERVAPQALDEVGAADDDPGLRAAEQLVAGEADEVRAGRRARRAPTARRARSVSDAGAEVVDERQLVPRARQPRAPRARGCSVKPTTRKFDWCTRRSTRGLGADRALVVRRARAVRRPDLDEARARAREHVGDAEAVADLDQLAARDDDLAALRERGEREQHRRRVVVDDERGLGAGQPAQDRRDVVLARAARARSSRSYSRFE